MNLFVNKGEPVALIENKKHKKRKFEFVGIFPSSGGEKSIEIKEDSRFSLLPFRDTRTKVFLAGPTGCGKTRFAMEFMSNYARLNPENTLLVITADTEDKTIEKAKEELPGLDKLEILDLDDEELYEEEEDEGVETNIFKNSCVFLDDTDHLNNTKLLKKIKDLKKRLIGMGRHVNTSVIISSHLIMDYRETRFILSEAHYIVTFPNGGSSYFIEQFFKKYFAKANSTIRNKIYQSGSRWCVTRMYYPTLILLEREIFIL